MGDNLRKILSVLLGGILSIPLLLGLERSLSMWPAILDDTRTGVLITARCPACEALFNDYQADPEKWANVIPVPLDEPGSPLGAAVCDATLDAMSGTRLTLAKLLPRRIVCARLAADAVAFARSEGMVVTPSFFSDGRLLKTAEVQSVLGFAPPYAASK